MIHNISRFIAALAILATAQGAWAEWTGTGYKSSPYIISTPEDLLLLAHRVNGTNGETANDYQGRYFKLGADITFSHAEYELYGSPYAENYEAIGCSIGGTDRSFKGDFDGDGHTVSGIRIRKTTVSSIYQGLFGCIGRGANIHDVHLTDARIKGYDNVGGIAGYNNEGHIVRCSVTDSYITANGNYYGTICGFTNYTGLLTNNYYHGCTVNGTAVTSGMGCQKADITANNGALPAYRLDLGDGVTIQTTMAADLGFSCDADNNGTAENYWRSGAVLTLGYTGTVPAGYLFDGLTATNGTVGGNANDGYTLTMPDQDAAITIAKTPDPAHFSVNDAGTEYTIHTAAGWGVFCDCLQDNDTYNRFSGKTVKLDADITVTRMAGGSGHEFTGTFDGDGHTLTVSISSSDSYAAPFREIMGATIRNLKVSGTVSGHKHSAGLVSYARGADSSVENTIENCLVATDVSTIVDTDGDCYLGGIVGHGFNCKLTIRGCAFTGSLTSPHNYTGGLQGWSDGNTLILEDDIFAASSVNAANVGFHPIAIHANNKTTTATVTNVYYTVAPTCTTASRIAAAGKAVRSVTAGTDVILYSPGPLNITNTYYNVSGIRTYTTGGLYYNHDLYYGSGDRLSILLENTRDDEPLGYRYTYAFSGGTADEYEYSADYGETSYHLTMPDQDVTISVNTAALLSTGQPVTVAYINADGTPGEASAIALDGTETSLAAGWYFVGKDIDYTATVTLDGDVNLILADGKTMNIGTSGNRISGCGIARENGGDQALTIYGQNAGTGALNVYTGNGNKGIVAKAVTINGGNVTTDANEKWSDGILVEDDIIINGGTVNATATGNNTWGLYANCNLTINGGNVNATGGANGIRATANVAINGGNVTATGGATGIYAGTAITLGWTRPADRITASSISTDGGTVAVADGQALTDGSGNIYTGTLTASVLSGIDAETTLQPCLALADAADNTAAIADHAGQTLAVALSGRTLYKDGSWNTLCLPFSVSTASGTLSGDGVQAMTLNTSSSSLADGTLTLNFDDATGETIAAGKPFIIKWDKPANYEPYDGTNAATCSDLVSPVFMGVTIDAEKHDASVTDVLTFTGTYAPVTIPADGDNTKLYLGAANKLYYPTAAMTIGTHRAYFQLADGITAGEPAAAEPTSPQPSHVRAFVLNFGDDEATGIVSAEANSSLFTLHSSLQDWYTLDGRRLQAKPTAPGIYINNGRKVVIK